MFSFYLFNIIKDIHQAQLNKETGAVLETGFYPFFSLSEIYFLSILKTTVIIQKNCHTESTFVPKCKEQNASVPIMREKPILLFFNVSMATSK
jgi:hypothetical protein